MENPFWREESHIRKLELELVATDDQEKKKQIEILLKRAEEDLESKKKAYYEQKQTRQQLPDDDYDNQGIGCGWWLLGFFFVFPFAIIGWIVLKIMKRNREATSLGWGIITGILAAILLAVILFVFNLFIFDSANKFTNSAMDNIQTTQTVTSLSSNFLEKNSSEISDSENVEAKDYLEDAKKEIVNDNGEKERADAVRRIMETNQGFDSEVLASIPDADILEANVGNATNSEIAQTAQNLLEKYPELKKE